MIVRIQRVGQHSVEQVEAVDGQLSLTNLRKISNFPDRAFVSKLITVEHMSVDAISTQRIGLDSYFEIARVVVIVTGGLTTGGISRLNQTPLGVKAEVITVV